VSKQSNLLWQ